MLIKVKYPDGTNELVRPSLLHYLIEKRLISAFERSSGWVTLGIDPVRQGRIPFSGPNRRLANFRSA